MQIPVIAFAQFLERTLLATQTAGQAREPSSGGPEKRQKASRDMFLSQMPAAETDACLRFEY